MVVGGLFLWVFWCFLIEVINSVVLSYRHCIHCGWCCYCSICLLILYCYVCGCLLLVAGCYLDVAGYGGCLL